MANLSEDIRDQLSGRGVRRAEELGKARDGGRPQFDEESGAYFTLK